MFRWRSHDWGDAALHILGGNLPEPVPWPGEGYYRVPTHTVHRTYKSDSVIPYGGNKENRTQREKGDTSSKRGSYTEVLSYQYNMYIQHRYT